MKVLTQRTPIPSNLKQEKMNQRRRRLSNGIKEKREEREEEESQIGGLMVR